MEPNKKFLKLLNSLKEATVKGRIEWSKTFDDETFRVILDHGVVRLAKTNDETAHTADVIATLADLKGETLESVSTSDLNTPDNFVLYNLYDAAYRRVNSKVDNLIDQLITEVESRQS